MRHCVKEKSDYDGKQSAAFCPTHKISPEDLVAAITSIAIWNNCSTSFIRHGTVSALLLMRKLAAYPRQNQVARTLTELAWEEQRLRGRRSFVISVQVIRAGAASNKANSGVSCHVPRSALTPRTRASSPPLY